MNDVNAASVVDARKSFGATQALRGVTMSVARGQIHALLGHNGAGKSTVVKLLAGALAPDSGSVSIAGHPLSAKPAEALRLGVRPIFQHRTLMPNMTVAENVTMFDRHGVVRHRAQAAELAVKRMRNLGCTVSPYRMVSTLGAGEAQEVEIARALDPDIQLLILDEPTASLSAKEMRRLMTVMREVRDLGVGVLLVSHDLQYVLAAADRVTVMRDGQIVLSDEASNVTRSHIVASMMGEIGGTFSPDTALDVAVPIADGDTAAVELVGVSGAVLDNVNFSIKPGEIVGVNGSLGSGIEEFASILVGASRPQHGQVRSAGQAVRFSCPRAALKRGIAYLPDDRAAKGLFPNLSPLDQIDLSRLAVSRGILLRRGKSRREAAQVGDQVSLTSRASTLAVRQLSGGNQQKILAARCLRANPRVLVAHEPTIGVDVVARAAIHDLFKQMAAAGASVIVVSSDAQELVEVAQRALVLRAGRLVLSAGEFTERELVSAAMGDTTDTDSAESAPSAVPEAQNADTAAADPIAVSELKSRR